jgi:hypothetical protein
MNNAVLARNLLLLSQAEEFSRLCAAAAIPVVLLKGIALVAIAGDYLPERTMDDIDLLIRPGDGSAVRALLRSAGYLPSPEDPRAFHRPGTPAAIDVNDALWYLDDNENHAVFDAALRHPVPGMPGAFHLPPDEFYRHVLAHAAVHHAINAPKWRKDLRVLKSLFGNSLDPGSVDEKLRRAGLKEAVEIYLADDEKQGCPAGLRERAYRWLLEKDLPMKGHVIRFLYTPPRRMLSYLFEALFPPAIFIEGRYGVHHRLLIAIFRLCRPFLLAAKLSAFICTVPFARRNAGQ